MANQLIEREDGARSMPDRLFLPKGERKRHEVPVKSASPPQI